MVCRGVCVSLDVVFSWHCVYWQFVAMRLYQSVFFCCHIVSVDQLLLWLWAKWWFLDLTGSATLCVFLWIRQHKLRSEPGLKHLTSPFTNRSAQVFPVWQKMVVSRGGARGLPGGPLPPQNFAWPQKNFPRDVMPLHWRPTQTIDSSPCCKTGPSSGPPNENVWLRPWL